MKKYSISILVLFTSFSFAFATPQLYEPTGCSSTQYWDGTACKETTNCPAVMGTSCVASPCATGYGHIANTNNCVVSDSVTDVDNQGDNNSCADITSNLRYLMRDTGGSTNVSILQDFLNGRGYLKSQPTGFFGASTRKAVIAFQNDNGLRATPPGYVGAGTRAKIKAIDCDGAQAGGIQQSGTGNAAISSATLDQNQSYITIMGSNFNLVRKLEIMYYTSSNQPRTIFSFNEAFGGDASPSIVRTFPLDTGKDNPKITSIQVRPVYDDGGKGNWFTVTIPSSCGDQSGAKAVITSLSSYSGPVGTSLKISGCNFAGFEGDKNARIENSQGVVGVLYGESGSTAKEINVVLKSPLCTSDNSYSGLPCNSYLTLTPGTYKIWTAPWGANTKSNSVTFTITSASPTDGVPYANLSINGSHGPLTLTAGDMLSITWNSKNVDYCTASGDSQWDGKQPTSGTVSLRVGNGKTVSVYTITCYKYNNGQATSASDSVTVTTSSAQEAPYNITLLSPNGGETLVSGQQSAISWTATNISKVFASLVSADSPGNGVGTLGTIGAVSSGNVVYWDGKTVYSSLVNGTPIIVPPGKYKIALVGNVASINGRTVSTMSNNSFSIVAPSVNPSNGIPTASFTNTPSCTIPIGQSKCTVAVQWKSSNPGNISLTDDAGHNTDTTVISIIGDGKQENSIVIPHGSTNFQIRDYTNSAEGKILATVTAKATCEFMSVWVNNVCWGIGNAPPAANPASLVPSGEPTSGKTSPNTASVKLGSFVLQAGSSYGLKFNSVVVSPVVSGYAMSNISNLTLKGNGLTLGTPVGHPNSGGTTFTFSDVTLPANGKLPLDVYADIGGATSGSVTTGIDINAVAPVAGTTGGGYFYTQGYTISTTGVAAGPAPSAKFTSTPSCKILAGDRGCLTPISWTSSDVESVSLTDSSPALYVIKGTGPQTSTVYIPYHPDGFYQLRNGSINGTIMATVSGDAECDTGLVWKAGATWTTSACVVVASSSVGMNYRDSVGSLISTVNKRVSRDFVKTVSTLSGAQHAYAASCVDIPKNLHRGFEESSVSKLQDFLIKKGFMSEKSGFYGDLTIEAVKAYQRSVGIKETGMVYEATRQNILDETCS